MTMMVSKQKLQAIRQSMKQALAQVAKEHGIESFSLGNIRYDESGFKVPVEAVFEGAENQDLKTLRLNAPRLGFKPEIAGATITYANKQYTVTGMGRSNLYIEDFTGKKYTAKVELIRHALEMQKSPLVEPRVPLMSLHTHQM